MYSNQYDISNNVLNIGSQELMQQITTNLNMFYRGIVVNVEDPMHLGRVQVRIPSIHGSNSNSPNYVDDSSLPWASPAIWSSAGNDMGEYTLPTAGNRVFVTFEGGRSDYPIYFGGIPTKIANTKYYKPEIGIMMGAKVPITTDDYNTDLVTGKERVLFKSFKGATIIIDDFDGDEYIRIIDQAGQTFTMGNKGDPLERRGNKLGVSSEGYIELSNNRGEYIKIIDGKVIIDGNTTEINSPNVSIPNWSGGGSGGDYYTKEQTDALLLTKSKVFFSQPTVPYNAGDAWYDENTVYRCINTRKHGDFNINDWEIDSTSTSPEYVNRAIYQEGNRILDVVSQTYVTPAYVDEKLNYEIQIVSTNGNIFKDNIVDTTLTAYVIKANQDVSNQFADNQFIWYRTSDDPDADILWNRNHITGSRSITLTKFDVSGTATFNCDLVDAINTVNYVKTGLIEIFDGYSKPTSLGEWVSMINTNKATVPEYGATYDDTKHAYRMNGVSAGMNLENNIEFKSGYTYEFCTELQTYGDTQNILSSAETNNDDIRNKIACAVAGHMTIKRNGKSANSGTTRINTKASVSIRFITDSEMDIYYNGSYVSRIVQSNWTSDDEYFNRIGRWCNGYIYSIRVYNRLLTPVEIKANYDEDINRFG